MCAGGGGGGRESNAFKRSAEEGKRERLFPFSSAFPDAPARTLSFSFLVQLFFSFFLSRKAKLFKNYQIFTIKSLGKQKPIQLQRGLIRPSCAETAGSQSVSNLNIHFILFYLVY